MAVMESERMAIKIPLICETEREGKKEAEREKVRTRILESKALASAGPDYFGPGMKQRLEALTLMQNEERMKRFPIVSWLSQLSIFDQFIHELFVGLCSHFCLARFLPFSFSKHQHPSSHIYMLTSSHPDRHDERVISSASQ